ncbi:MAG: hypothetical protein BGO72_19570 [Burkholderiales bacterium 70-64]|nr:MAG: hypothetical protein BGO72_19570 [Burkholderiales bacterium 70-64]
MRIMLLNDTGVEPHIGCQAVSDAHARMLGAAGHEVGCRYFLGELRGFAGHDEVACIDRVLRDENLRAELENVDAVVVNGEGTLHHGAGTENFAVLGAAQRMGKLTAIVNAVFEAHAGWLDVLNALDDFCVRDARSLKCAQAFGLRCRLVPDSFLAAEFSDRPIMNLEERIAVTDWHPSRNHDVGAAMNAMLSAADATFYFPLMHGVHAHLWRHAPATLESASWVITARHHGVYLASVAQRPFVALPSNTAKIEGLIEAAGARIPVCTRADQIEEAMRFAMENLDEYRRLADFLASQLPLTTFRVLGSSGSAPSAAREVERLQAQLASCSWSPQPRYWGLAPHVPGSVP